MIKALEIAKIQTDCGTQVRNAICEDTVAEYAERMTEGDKFPACHVFSDGNGFYLADGFHRIMAAQRVGFLDFPCEIHKGTIKDATWFALGANRTNGRRLTRGDVRSAVEKALETWPDRTQQAIADQVGCAQSYVASVKKDIITGDNTAKHWNTNPADKRYYEERGIDLPATRTDSIGRTRPTSYAKPEPPKMEEEGIEESDEPGGDDEAAEDKNTKKIREDKGTRPIPAAIEAALNRLETEINIVSGAGWPRCNRKELSGRIRSILKGVER